MPLRFLKYPPLEEFHNNMVSVPLGSQFRYHNSVSFFLIALLWIGHSGSTYRAPMMYQALFQGLRQRNEKTGSILGAGTLYPLSLIANSSQGSCEQFYTSFNPIYLYKLRLEFANERDLWWIGKEEVRRGYYSWEVMEEKCDTIHIFPASSPENF